MHRRHRPAQNPERCARAAPDRPAPRQRVTPLVMQRCPRQATGNDGGEVSSTLIAPTPLATSTIDATAQKQYAKARHPCACSARRAERGSVKEKTGAPYGNRTRVSAVKGRPEWSNPFVPVRTCADNPCISVQSGSDQSGPVFSRLCRTSCRTVSVSAVSGPHMARRVKHPKLDSRSGRRTLKQRREPYWVALTAGLAVGFRKGATGGTWVARHYGANGRRYQALGAADDVLDAGPGVLTFDQ